QKNAVDPVLRSAYRHDLHTLLLPRVANQLEAQVRANLDERSRLLGSLRAYLMLHMDARRDPAFLKDWLASDWSLRYAGNAQAQQGLNSHFERLLAEGFSPHPLNDQLVAEARQVLRSESLAEVVYRMLRDQARSMPDYQLNQKLSPRGGVFTGTDYRIPGFYTQRGYQQYFVAQGAELVREILRDNWVLGESDSLSLNELSRLLVSVEQL